MQILAEIKPQPQTKSLTYNEGWNDAIYGKMPQTCEFSPYYSGYLAASLRYDLVPF